METRGSTQKEAAINNAVMAILSAPSTSDANKSIAEVLLDGSYKEEDLRRFTSDTIFPSNADRQNRENTYLGMEVALAMIRKIAPYMSQYELYILTERALDVEIRFAAGPLRTSTLAKALLNELLISQQPHNTDVGALPELFLQLVNNEKAMSKLFPGMVKYKNQLEQAAPSASDLRTANLTIHDLFINMLVEANLFPHDAGAQYGRMEYSFADQMARKPDTRQFVNYYAQIADSRLRAFDKENLSKVAPEDEASKAAFLKEHAIKVTVKPKLSLKELGRTISERFKPTSPRNSEVIKPPAAAKAGSAPVISGSAAIGANNNDAKTTARSNIKVKLSRFSSRLFSKSGVDEHAISAPVQARRDSTASAEEQSSESVASPASPAAESINSRVSRNDIETSSPDTARDENVTIKNAPTPPDAASKDSSEDKIRIKRDVEFKNASANPAVSKHVSEDDFYMRPEQAAYVLSMRPQQQLIIHLSDNNKYQITYREGGEIKQSRELWGVPALESYLTTKVLPALATVEQFKPGPGNK